MSKKANPVAIGIFVVGASMLALIAIMVFGAAKFFTKTETVVCYFQDSINGLDVGAPVKYKGVTIGKVKDISIFVSPTDVRKSSISVYLSIDLDVVKRRTKEARKDGGGSDSLMNQIDDGLRAMLNYQSIVTGMLYVELDFFANPGEKYVLHKRRGDMVEIPVAPSGLSDLAKKIENTMLQISEIDFKSIGENLDRLLVSANGKISELDVQAINASLVASLKNIEKLSADSNLRESLKNLNKMLVDAQSFMSKTDAAIGSLHKNASGTMEKVNTVLDDVDAAISPQSPFRYELSMLLKNLGDASISVKALADFIERNPNAIITGKPSNEK